MTEPTRAGGEPAFSRAAGRIPFLRALPADDLERLRPYAQVRRLARGEVLWREGDPTAELIFVARGRVKLVKSCEGGREVIVDLCGPGKLLCSSAPCAFAPYCCTAVAMEDEADAVIISRRDLLALLERSPAASQAFLREVTCRDMILGQRIQELASGQVERRLATLLLRLADQLGCRHQERGTWIPLALSRQELADLCGTTLETTIRVMSRLSRQGVVRTGRGGFHVPDPPALKRIAEG